MGGTLAPDDGCRRASRRLDRVPHWAGRELAFHFGEVVEHLATIEPRASQFMPDRLRSSPLLVYSTLLDGLLREANA